MHRIDAQSEKLGREVGFVGTVGKDKEIRLTVLPVENGNVVAKAPLEAQINQAYPTAE